jgi:hypothetical protein
VLNHSYYDTIAYEDILKSFVGDAKLIESQVSKRTRSGGGANVNIFDKKLPQILNITCSKIHNI